MATKSGWTVKYVNKAVRRDMQAQPESIQAAFSRIRQLIEDEGIFAVPRQYKERVRRDIWEMRLTGDGVISRALYLKRVRNRVIVVHVFIKKKPKIDRHHIQLALKRAKEFDRAEQK